MLASSKALPRSTDCIECGLNLAYDKFVATVVALSNDIITSKNLPRVSDSILFAAMHHKGALSLRCFAES